eukprot:212385_1
MATIHLKHKKILPYVVCVEGNIGSGKSTLLSNLKKRGFTVIEEPVNDIWGQYLPRLYQDLTRWGFCFQMEAMDWFRQLQSKKFEQELIKMKKNTNAESKEESENLTDEDYEIENDQENIGDIMNISDELSPKKQSKKVIIVERSALSAITIFAKNLLDTGNMTKWEYSLLERFYSMIAWEPKHILYIQVNPERCCERIQKRNRNGEGNVDSTLIKNLHNKHEIMFNNMKSSLSQNIIIVNGRNNEQSVLNEALKKIEHLEEAI